VRQDKRELKHRLRRSGRRQVKNEFIFYQRNSRLSRFVQYASGSKNVLRLNMQWQRSIADGNTKNQPSSFAFFRLRRTWSFHVPVLQTTVKKCTKVYNARAQLLFCSLNLLFGDILVAVIVVVCSSSLLSPDNPEFGHFTSLFNRAHMTENACSKLLFFQS